MFPILLCFLENFKSTTYPVEIGVHLRLFDITGIGPKVTRYMKTPSNHCNAWQIKLLPEFIGGSHKWLAWHDTPNDLNQTIHVYWQHFFCNLNSIAIFIGRPVPCGWLVNMPMCVCVIIFGRDEFVIYPYFSSIFISSGFVIITGHMAFSMLHFTFTIAWRWQFDFCGWPVHATYVRIKKSTLLLSTIHGFKGIPSVWLPSMNDKW